MDETTQPVTVHRGAETDEAEFLPRDGQQTLEWITVLSAAGLDYRLSRPDRQTWVVHVPRGQFELGRAELEAYEADNGDWPSDEPPPAPQLPRMFDSWSPWWVAGALLAAYYRLGPYSHGIPYARAGALDTGAFLHGEWWRVITALTLHADISHVAGNAFAIALLGAAACRIFGGGLSWALILFSGIAGNALAAFIHGPDQVSVGASTACFGAMGILAAHQAVRNLRHFGPSRGVWSRTWLPLGAGLALATLLGTGPRSDLVAHAGGFVAGLVVVLPISRRDNVDRIPTWAQRALQLVCIATVMVAWRAAINHSGV